MKFDFGCALDKHEGWIGSDLIDYGQEHVGNILDGLPFPDGYFDYAVAHHALQMFDYTRLPVALAELRRVLKNGRPLRVSVPDTIRAFEAYQRGDKAALIIPDIVEPTLDGAWSAYITWYGTNKTLFTFEFA